MAPHFELRSKNDTMPKQPMSTLLCWHKASLSLALCFPLYTTTMSSSSALSSSTRPSGALSTATNNQHKLRSKGCLEVTLLQLADLPYKDRVPLGVQFSIVPALAADDKKKTTKVWSGPPTQRRGSSVRFAPGVLELVEPLRCLYHSKLRVEVVYNGNSDATSSDGITAAVRPVTLLHGELQLRRLGMHRPRDLALKLRPTQRAGGDDTAMLVAAAADDDDDHSCAAAPPTVRLRLQLHGPLRPTVQTALRYLRLYLGLVDQVQDAVWEPFYQTVIEPLLPVLPVGLGLGAVPVVTTALVVSPLVLGVSLLCFPITLPLLVLTVLMATGGACIVALLLCSTRHGRDMIDGNVLQRDWVQSHIVTSPVTQSVLYDTGDDDAIPNPVSVLRWYVVPEDMWYRLFFSLFIDLVGSCSYLIPVIGESFDGPWAPIQSMLIMALYNQTTPNLKYVSLAEELLPFTDVLPSCTIGWATENMPGLIEEWKEVYEKGGGGAGGVARLLRIGSDDGSSNSSNASSGSSSTSSSTNDAKINKKPGPTPEQKRSILRDMQNYSERLSVQSP